MWQSYEFYSTSGDNPCTILPILTSLSILHVFHKTHINSFTGASGELIK
ncbi:hypothetical protein BOVA604_382 [Bacteroides ovatus]|nr:hypothetical protein BOVA604_382 [Bacteroides ovatus]